MRRRIKSKKLTADQKLNKLRTTELRVLAEAGDDKAISCLIARLHRFQKTLITPVKGRSGCKSSDMFFRCARAF